MMRFTRWCVGVFLIVMAMVLAVACAPSPDSRLQGEWILEQSQFPDSARPSTPAAAGNGVIAFYADGTFSCNMPWFYPTDGVYEVVNDGAGMRLDGTNNGQPYTLNCGLEFDGERLVLQLREASNHKSWFVRAGSDEAKKLIEDLEEREREAAEKEAAASEGRPECWQRRVDACVTVRFVDGVNEHNNGRPWDYSADEIVAIAVTGAPGYADDLEARYPDVAERYRANAEAGFACPSGGGFTRASTQNNTLQLECSVHGVGP